MDRGHWWATVHGVAKSWTLPSLHTHTQHIKSNSQIHVYFLIELTFKCYYLKEIVSFSVKSHHTLYCNDKFKKGALTRFKVLKDVFFLDKNNINGDLVNYV